MSGHKISIDHIRDVAKFQWQTRLNKIETLAVEIYTALCANSNFHDINFSGCIDDAIGIIDTIDNWRKEQEQGGGDE